MLFEHVLILVRGGGDLASGVVYRLHQAGFPVVVTELTQPKLVRRAVSFGEAVYSGAIHVEGLAARHIKDPEVIQRTLSNDEIPVLVDHDGELVTALQPIVIVDARMEKKPLDSTIDAAPLVIGLGPGFEAGTHCHVIIETNRGHNLGRVIRTGMAEPDTGTPGAVQGITGSRVLRAPCDGFVASHFSIGDQIKTNDVIATVKDTPVVAQFDGVLRGLVHPSLPVMQGMKIGDLDPRAKREHCFTFSDKSLAVGGGVVEAVLSTPQIRSILKIEQL